MPTPHPLPPDRHDLGSHQLLLWPLWPGKRLLLLVSFLLCLLGQLIGLLAVLLLPDIARIRADAVGRDRAQDQEIATLKARLAVLESAFAAPAGTRVESPPAAPAVFPARTEEVVTCPRCGRRQKGNRASCYACGLPFRYEQE